MKEAIVKTPVATGTIVQQVPPIIQVCKRLGQDQITNVISRAVFIDETPDLTWDAKSGAFINTTTGTTHCPPDC